MLRVGRGHAALKESKEDRPLGGKKKKKKQNVVSLGLVYSSCSEMGGRKADCRVTLPFGFVEGDNSGITGRGCEWR